MLQRNIDAAECASKQPANTGATAVIAHRLGPRCNKPSCLDRLGNFGVAKY
jgi:hypothetical protein